MRSALPASLLLLVASRLHGVQAQNGADEAAAYNTSQPLVLLARSAMLGSMRASWEQGVAASALLEFDYPSFSLFGDNPFSRDTASPAIGVLPVTVLQLAHSAVTRKGSDGRLAQKFGDGNDGSSLDGASCGPAVLLGMVSQPTRISYWRNAAVGQLNYLLNIAPRTSAGAISHRADGRKYWADGVFMGPPFIAQYGALVAQRDLLQIGYDQCSLYYRALVRTGSTGRLWAHIWSDDGSFWEDAGLWATGNAWAALGMLHVATAIDQSDFRSSMFAQRDTLLLWVREVLDGMFAALVPAKFAGANCATPLGLVPNYVDQDSFGDAAASAALVAVVYRARVRWPTQFGQNYIDTASTVRQSILTRFDPELGFVRPVVDPVSWHETGDVSTEAQAFFLMMMSAWRDWIVDEGGAVIQ